MRPYFAFVLRDDGFPWALDDSRLPTKSLRLALEKLRLWFAAVVTAGRGWQSFGPFCFYESRWYKTSDGNADVSKSRDECCRHMKSFPTVEIKKAEAI